MTKLFYVHSSVLTVVITKSLNFVKKLSDFIKKSYSEDSLRLLLQKHELDKTKYYDYINEDKVVKFNNHIQKDLKEIKKLSFQFLKKIYLKFYNQKPLIIWSSRLICNEYKEILTKFETSTNPKFNSLLDFVASFSNNTNIHYVFIENNFVLQSVLSMLKNDYLQKDDLVKILDFVMNLILPYYNFNVVNEVDNFIGGKINENTEKDDVVMKPAKKYDTNVKITDTALLEYKNEVMQDDNEMDFEHEQSVELTISNETFKEFETKLIKNNFVLINSCLLSLVENGSIEYKLSNNITKKLLDIFLYLWSSYDNSIYIDTTDLLTFLLNLMDDHNIFEETHSNVLGQILKISHLLLISNKNKNFYYRSFLKLLYQIKEINNRLILSIILQDFKDYYGKNDLFEKILDSLCEFNRKNISSLDNTINIKVILDSIEQIDESVIRNGNLNLLEPIIYQLFYFIASDDFSLQTISIQKLNEIFDSVLNRKSLLEIYELFEEKETITNLPNLNENYIAETESFVLKDIIKVLYILQTRNSLSLTKNLMMIFFNLNDIVNNKINTETTDNVSYNNEVFNIIGRDLFLCEFTNEFIKTEKYNFFEGILNIKFELRIQTIHNLNTILLEKKISKRSINNFIIPIYKTFLNPFSYFQINKVSFSVYRLEGQVYELIYKTIESLGVVVKNLTYSEISELLRYFMKLIEKINKKSHMFDESIRSILYKSMSRVLENIKLTNNFKYVDAFETKIKEEISKIFAGNIFDFFRNENMNKNKSELDIEKIQKKVHEVQKSTEDIYKTTITKVNESYKVGKQGKKIGKNGRGKSGKFLKENNEKEQEAIVSVPTIPSVAAIVDQDAEIVIEQPESIQLIDEILIDTSASEEYTDLITFLNEKVYKLLRNLIIDTAKKQQNKTYYIRNFALQPFIEVVKLLNPEKIQFEFRHLLYEVINNLKSKDIDTRDKSREAILFMLEGFGPFISNLIFDELINQLKYGYQRYVMGYTCNFIITYLNKLERKDKQVYFDYLTSSTVPILLEEIFGIISEEKEVEVIIKKYKEAREVKSFETFFILSSNITFKHSILNIVYPLRNIILNR